MDKFKFLIFLILSNLIILNGFAKTFSSQFSEFELPTGWECVMEGSEYVCQSDDAERKKEAIIIFAAKYRGEQDSLDLYQAYLKKEKPFLLPGGKTQISEPKSVTIKEINGQKWVDALHLASEVPGFYTRYLATVKDNLGIAVTFSVAKDHYDSYQDIFEKIIATLRVFDQKFAKDSNWVKKNTTEELLDGSAVVGDTAMLPDISKQEKNKNTEGSGGTDTYLMIGALILVAGIFIKMKKKKK